MHPIRSKNVALSHFFKKHALAALGTGKLEPIGEMPGFECDVRTVVFPRQGGGMIRMKFLQVRRINDEGRLAYHFPLIVEIVKPSPGICS